MSHKRNAHEQSAVPTGTDIELEIATSLRQSPSADNALHTKTAEITDPAEQTIDASGMEHVNQSKLRTATVMIALCVCI